MLKSQKIRVRGVPCSHQNGNGDGRRKWTRSIVEKTKGLRKVTGACLLRVTFKLPADKFRANPFGTDLDNLLKGFLDALGHTVLSDAAGQDACIVSLEATKVVVANAKEAGVDGEIVQMD